MPAFFTATGFGTMIGEGKESRKYAGKDYILEEAFPQADFSLIKAWKADKFGNLMCSAGKITVVEVEEIVEPGELDPNFIHVPGIYVDRVIKGKFEKRIEQKTVKG